MHRYRAYGLRIDSEFALPGLLPGDGPADAVVHAGEVDPGSEPAPVPRFVGSAREGILSWDEAGAARVRNGEDVVVGARQGVDDGMLAAFVVGPVFGILLSQRGLTPLHASAVAVDGRAVAFLGGPGWGKSTLAAALHARGHPIVADDIVAVRLADARATVLPGFPQLKLWPETVSTLGGDPDGLARVVAGAHKRLRPSPAGFSHDELPLAGIYVLADEGGPQVEPLEPADAVIELVRHAWAARSLHATAPAERLSRFARLAETVPVRRLRRPMALESLAELGEFVEREVAP
jgi:hypothetical protein